MSQEPALWNWKKNNEYKKELCVIAWVKNEQYEIERKIRIVWNGLSPKRTIDHIEWKKSEFILKVKRNSVEWPES